MDDLVHAVHVGLVAFLHFRGFGTLVFRKAVESPVTLDSRPRIWVAKVPDEVVAELLVRAEKRELVFCQPHDCVENLVGGKHSLDSLVLRVKDERVDELRGEPHAERKYASFCRLQKSPQVVPNPKSECEE